MVSFRSLIVAATLFLTNPVASPAEPIISLAGTMPESGDYGEVLVAFDAIGAQATSLTLYWDDLEKGGVYAADPDWPKIAQAVYPARGLKVQLTFAVIDTLSDRRPADLRALAWNDKRVAERFAVLVAEVLERTPDIEYVSIAIGNEVDGHLVGSAVDEYAQFFKGARDVIRSLRPDIPVTIKVMWSVLKDRREIRALARHGDALSITWYPMDNQFRFADPATALRQLSEMDAMAKGPWELSEVGFPSNGCGASSPEAQARFHTGLTKASASLANLRLIQRVWSHDISGAAVASYLDYYKTDAKCFMSFLASLGLRTADDKAKPAFDALARR